MKRETLNHQKGAALVMVLQLTVVGALMVGGIAFLVTSQNQFNSRTLRSERALWMAETGTQRFLAGFRNQNDCITKDISATNLNTSCNGYWLNSWIPVRDENSKTIGEYRITMLPGDQSSSVKRIKSEGKVYISKSGTTEIGVAKRVIGAQLERFSLDNFAIASNNQLGGARINGGAKIHGGIFTSGRLGLDSSSTGIYNDYSDLNDAQNFPATISGNPGYSIPAIAPRAEVYVYKDNITNPPPTPNGGIEIASQSKLGTNTDPMKAIHTDASVVDPGTGANPPLVTVGDGVVGNGEDTQVHADKRDHELPTVTFPDASAGSTYMEERRVEAAANGCQITGPVTLDGSDYSGCANFTYSATNKLITISGPVYITGDLTLQGPIKYVGRGAVFVIGDILAVKGIEPNVPADYPQNAALGLIASSDMSLTEGNGSSVRYAGSFFGNDTLTIEQCKVFGNIFGGTVNLPTTSTRPDIYVHPEVRAKTGVPMPDFPNSKITKAQWWEMHSDAAK